MMMRDILVGAIKPVAMRSRRSSCALTTTMAVLSDVRSTPMAG
jgi:hypothetical protein